MNRAVVSVAGAAAIAALFGAGSASAAVDGDVTFKTQGSSILASIDATTDMADETISCKLDVVNQATVSTTKTAFKSAESPAGLFAQTLKVENLEPGKYDAKIHCHETTEGEHDEAECLDKTAVLTVVGATTTTTTPGTTTPGTTTPTTAPPLPPFQGTDTEGTDTGDDTSSGTAGLFAMLQSILASIFAS